VKLAKHLIKEQVDHLLTSPTKRPDFHFRGSPSNEPGEPLSYLLHNKLMDILKELEGKDIYTGSYDAGLHSS